MLSDRVIVYLLLAFLLEGCAGHLHPVEKAEQEAWLPFIEDGKTRKEEVLLHLGVPSARFQGERVFSYRLRLDEKKQTRFVVVAREFPAADPRLLVWVLAEYDLVLVFDDRQVLQRHSLIKVR